ncbi:hypothetical protein SLEP1_g25185 [Rubroshorea leprosula]|uniref:Uncharacterized protein n=1 Tax=Rubroshorea leprosula TaxID=152421 RepID=A0AAV5JNG2_9ROSI|nr:hypothetical protein SLEP1_g25185 [Rubroshorea leprosula]
MAFLPTCLLWPDIGAKPCQLFKLRAVEGHWWLTSCSVISC